jgi:hypothetical protein
MSNEFIALKCVQRSIGDDNLTNMLETNIKTFYDYVLLSSLGAWTEVTLPTSGIYGADFSVLKLVDDPNYDTGQVWEGGRKDWVWETGVNYVDTTGGIQNPLPVGYPVVSGVTITGGYHVNYPQGKVVFNFPVAESASVRIPYSYRNIQLYKADDAPWWEEIQYNSYRLDSNDFAQSASGDWSIFGENRIQLPAVVIEAVPRGGLNNRGYEIGSEALIASRDIKFHILAENRFDRNNLMDIFNLQSEYNIVLFDTNDLTASSDYPLDYRGMLTGTKMYPDFIVDHKFKHCRFVNSSISDVTQVHPGLYMASVRTTMEVVV